MHKIMDLFLNKYILLFSIIFSQINFANAQRNANTLIPLDSAVRTGKLANGFTYFIRRNTEPQKRVVLYLVNKVGSVLENEDQRGLAHFLEHMNFNGTKHFPKNQLVDYLQKAGVRFGSDLNAYTSFDETVYQLPIPSDKPELLKNGLQIMRDWAQEALLDGTEIDAERGVILEEKRLRNNADSRMRDLYLPVLLNHSRYSDRLPIGTEEILKTFPYSAIHKFYNDWYRPDLQALIIVGDIDVDAIEKELRVLFGDLKQPTKPLPRIDYKIDLIGKPQFIAVTDRENTQTNIQLMYKFPTTSLRTVEDYRSGLIRSLVNQMSSARYSELSMLPGLPFINCSAGINSFMGGLDLFYISTTAKPGELESSFECALTEVERINRYGFTDSELTREKTNYLKSIEQALKEKDHTESERYVKEYLNYFLKDEASPGIEKEYELTKKFISQITIEDCNELVRSCYAIKDRDIVIIAPDKDKATLPDEALVNKWIDQIKKNDIKPYKEKGSDKPFFNYQPKAGKIVKSKADKKLGITTLILSNGVKVVLKLTDFKANEILLYAFSSGGSSLYPDSDYMSASQSAGIVNNCGVDSYNPVELSKKLTGKTISLNNFISERMEGVKGSSSVNDFETALQLLWLRFTHPRVDNTLFTNIIENTKANLKTRGNNPASIFADTISSVFGNYNYRRTPFDEFKVDQIKLDKVLSVYKERFENAGNFTFVITGSFDKAKIDSLVCVYLGSLPSTGRFEKAKDLGIRSPKGVIVKKVLNGKADKATVRLVFHGDYHYGREENMQLNALNEILEFKLIERLREQESGVYSPGVSHSITKSPVNTYSLTVSFGCSPTNVEKLIAATFDEISKLKNKGAQQADVDKFKAEELNSYQTKLKTNDFWSNYLFAKLSSDENPEDILTQLNLLKTVSSKSVQKAACLYTNDKNYIQFVLLPKN